MNEVMQAILTRSHALQNEFGIPSDHVVYGMAALGYADGEPGTYKECGEVAFVE